MECRIGQYLNYFWFLVVNDIFQNSPWKMVCIFPTFPILGPQSWVSEFQGLRKPVSLFQTGTIPWICGLHSSWKVGNSGGAGCFKFLFERVVFFLETCRGDSFLPDKESFFPTYVYMHVKFCEPIEFLWVENDFKGVSVAVFELSPCQQFNHPAWVWVPAAPVQI